ncbi:ATP:cob(I)alamin adenosyltransferase [Halobacteriovorax marinus]|uniref:Corrinoid adenosyltransferase n=1 Tax=Halobacteriovorax marinus TaxID=97084 RepID=A0A1Y5F1G2_9BACT|nr:ATP:cob(I)alamin adenosyltransferase [Halobacteriovorax marinus]
MTDKSKVYTRSGDKGLTGLVGGTRVSKGDSRIHIYGEVDELNAQLGVVISMIETSDLDSSSLGVPLLLEIQHNLFVIGSNFACEKERRGSFSLPEITDVDVKKIEDAIDDLDGKLTPLKHFVLPGGHVISSNLHVSRTVCRRVERYASSYESQNQGELPQESLKYLNRLSDYFFVLSRMVNNVGGVKEIYWIP